RQEPAGVADVDEAPLSPNGAVQHPAPRPVSVEALPPDPRVAPEDRAGGAVEALRASRLDFLFRSKAAARPAPQPEQFETYARAEAPSGHDAETDPQPQPPPQPRASPVERHAHVAPPVARRAAPPAAPQPPTAPPRQPRPPD